MVQFDKIQRSFKRCAGRFIRKEYPKETDLGLGYLMPVAFNSCDFKNIQNIQELELNNPSSEHTHVG